VFRKKQPDTYVDSSVTLVDYKLVERFYNAEQLIELVYAFFLHYGIELGKDKTKKETVEIFFHRKDKFSWERRKPQEKNFTKTINFFSFLFPFVFLVDLLLGGYYDTQHILTKFLMDLKEDIIISFALASMAYMLSETIKEKLGWVVHFAATTTKNASRTKICIDIYNTPKVNKKDFLQILFHELDHTLWAFEGKNFNKSRFYEERPHEIRAQERGKKWAEVVLANESKNFL